MAEDADAKAADESETKEVTIEEKLQEDIDWSNYLDEYNTPGRVQYESEDRDTPKFESFIAHKESLNSHLLWQFLMTKPDKEEETKVKSKKGKASKKKAKTKKKAKMVTTKKKRG